MSEAAKTIAQLLESAKIDKETLRRRHGPLMELPRRVLGVVPNCHPYMEIWPTGLQSYNLLMPNFLNMPFSMWGMSAPMELVGLAMYTSSRTASCMYCSAHGCAFALRRGQSPGTMADALDPDAERTDVERAVIEVARGLSTIPASVGEAELADLRRLLPAQADWILLVVVLMGFLNKCMDTLGIELERAVDDDVRGVISQSGWTPGRHGVAPDDPSSLAFRTDSLSSKLALVPLLPGALSRETRWTRGVPKAWPEAGRYLEQQVGYDFPLLSALRPARVVRALTTVLRNNLSPDGSALGMPAKQLAGLAFSLVLDNQQVIDMSRALARVASVPAAQLEAVEQWARTSSDFGDADALGEEVNTLGAIDGLDDAAVMALLVAKAMTENPSRVTPQLLARCTPALSSAAMIELVIWVSILQLLHRMTVAFRSDA